MSVLLETSLGDLVVDLLTADAPKISENFLKLCKLKHYNDSLFFRIEKDFIALAGHASIVRDPINSGAGPTAWGLAKKIYKKPTLPSHNELTDYIPDEISPDRKHDTIGILATANEHLGKNGSTFYITLAKNLQSLDNKHTIFGYIVEGVDEVLMAKFNTIITDDRNVPLQPIRIRHTIILDDPYSDPDWFATMIPPNSPPPIDDQIFQPIESVEDELRLLERISQNEARSRAIALEILGDIPDADMKPPDNVLFICKLNPYTEEEDLETIFSQFGKIVSCNIIKDWKTGDSLLYGFIEFEAREACENAYFKMQDALIDDRRVHVDFCQSVSDRYFAFKRHGDRATRQDAIEVLDSTTRKNHRGESYVPNDTHSHQKESPDRRKVNRGGDRDDHSSDYRSEHRPQHRHERRHRHDYRTHRNDSPPRDYHGRREYTNDTVNYKHSKRDSYSDHQQYYDKRRREN